MLDLFAMVHQSFNLLSFVLLFCLLAMDAAGWVGSACHWGSANTTGLIWLHLVHQSLLACLPLVQQD
ncbi:MAG: hypothetical protein MPL62_15635, partial [Alphaproteobacteria bacterium]|nr:hypothetical protein [Alphaproteobacteria bacterium]